ncbi:MAG: transposase [Caldilineaceae bacterium]|nr:transposase [Caldilineaceae bacterium]MBP8123937.1 transposase [Caldilineaceae bacterium]MBP9073472.1 transposase [Caldilineaceae bacterium]
MPIRDVQFVKGQYYHIYNRGANRLSIFRNDADFRLVLNLIKKVSIACNLSIIAYCLMPNHYHWLIRQNGEAPARLLPQRVFGSYTRKFNHRYERSGTLFEGRFKANLVEDDVYLRHLCRYIHANPVKDGFALAPDLWPYSNYLEWIQKRNGSLVDRAFVEDFFSTPSAYAAFVAAYAEERSQVPDAVRWYLDSLDA